MAGRYGIIDPVRGEGAIELSNGLAVPIRGHCGYTDSRDAAQEAAELVGGEFVEREEPSFSQKGAYAIQITRCRACNEGVCTLGSHQDPLARW